MKKYQKKHDERSGEWYNKANHLPGRQLQEDEKWKNKREAVNWKKWAAAAVVCCLCLMKNS